MEKGNAPCEKEGGSTRRKGELDARRLETALRRLFFGEPRLWLMGVDFAVFGEERDLRTDGREVAGEAVRETLDLAGDATREKRAGFTKSWLLERDFLVGELKTAGSAFSQSSSSKISGSRRRLPMDEGALGFNGHAKLGVLGDDRAAQRVQLQSWLGRQLVLPFCLFLELPRACRRGVLISPKGWRVEVAISTDLQQDEWRCEKRKESRTGNCD
jgi:hypothetical protein